VPSALFDRQDVLRAFLGTELSRRLDEQVDAHVVQTVEDASPPSDSTGTTLPEKIRRAVASMRDIGGEPSAIALSPSDSAGLDLFEDSAGNLVFSVRSTNSGSPIWNLQVREAPAVSAPLLVDPRGLGVVYTGQGTVLVDPYSSMERNLVRVRVEVEAVMHIRNIGQGAFQIA
jgi:hypothetical protein